MPRPRVLLVLSAGLVLGAILSLAGCGGPPVPAARGPSVPVSGVPASGPAEPTVADRASGPARVLPAAEVLHRWDASRARAYAAGDVTALRRLYAAGSRARTTDVRMLRAYLRRGLRVEGMRRQVIAIEVVHQTPRRLVLRVTDRLAAGAAAVGRGTRVDLPAGRAATRVVSLRRAGAAAPWLVVSVRL